MSEAGPLGVSVLQILPYRRHHIPDAEELARFRAARERVGAPRLVVHSRFVPSPASSNAARRARSMELLARELSLAAALKAESFVLHAGACSPGDGAREAGDRLARTIREAVLVSGTTIPILLENVPGGGRRMGGGLEELAGFLERLRALSVSCGLCLDTAHAWAAGYEIATPEGLDDFMGRAESLAGREAIRLFHLNDTRAGLGSHIENHWHWGDGCLSRGLGLSALLARPGYANIPAILETPKGPGLDERNLNYVRGLAG